MLVSAADPPENRNPERYGVYPDQHLEDRADFFSAQRHLLMNQMTDNNTQSIEYSRDLPAFVRQVGSKAIRYWVPERSGDSEADRLMGREHFKEALEFSCRPNAQMFLAHVLVAMFQNVGPMEAGFIDALLEKAQVGAAPPLLTDSEAAAMEASVEGLSKLRALESEMAEAIAARHWLPDILRFTLLMLLNGADGEFIWGAATMIARAAINGSRN